MFERSSPSLASFAGDWVLLQCVVLYPKRYLLSNGSCDYMYPVLHEAEVSRRVRTCILGSDPTQAQPAAGGWGRQWPRISAWTGPDSCEFISPSHSSSPIFRASKTHEAKFSNFLTLPPLRLILSTTLTKRLVSRMFPCHPSRPDTCQPHLDRGCAGTSCLLNQMHLYGLRGGVQKAIPCIQPALLRAGVGNCISHSPPYRVRHLVNFVVQCLGTPHRLLNAFMTSHKRAHPHPRRSSALDRGNGRSDWCSQGDG